MLLAMADGWPSPNLNTLSMTDSSVLVVSRPQKEAQSFTTMPAPMTSLPLLIVPACGNRKNTLAKTPSQKTISTTFFFPLPRTIHTVKRRNTKEAYLCVFIIEEDSMHV